MLDVTRDTEVKRIADFIKHSLDHYREISVQYQDYGGMHYVRLHSLSEDEADNYRNSGGLWKYEHPHDIEVMDILMYVGGYY